MKIRHGLQQCLGSLGEVVKFKDASWSIPHDCFGCFYFASKKFHALWPTVHTFPVIRDALLFGDKFGLLVILELFSTEPVDRQSDLATFGFCLVEHALHNVSTLLVEKALTNLHAKTLLQEGVGHSTANDDAICFVDQILDELNLVINLCTTHDGYQWASWGSQNLREGLQLLLNQQASDFLRQIATHHGRVGSVCCSEGIIDIDITKL
mmetsp:Transcript_40259/g.56133  ORF Transcript_40259/g.56133 Transcript_40259/m.56133 type:complete len:209 (+) Transcript_40259:641-1267(+)